MSKWAEYGYPDGIKPLMPFLYLIDGIAKALEEREILPYKTIYGIWRFYSRSTDLWLKWAQGVDRVLLNVNGLFPNYVEWINPRCENVFTINERGALVRTPESYLTPNVVEAILGEPIIYVKDWVFENHFIEWALQRYKIINLFYKSISRAQRWCMRTLRGYGRSSKSARDAFDDAVAKLHHGEWSLYVDNIAFSVRVSVGYGYADVQYQASKLQLHSAFDCTFAATLYSSLSQREGNFESSKYSEGINVLGVWVYSGKAKINTEFIVGEDPPEFSFERQVFLPLPSFSGFGCDGSCVIYDYSVPGGFEFLDL